MRCLPPMSRSSSASPARAALTHGPLFKFLDDHKIPHMVFINKMDTASAACATSRRAAGRLAAAAGASPGAAARRCRGEITGYVDLVSERAYQ